MTPETSSAHRKERLILAAVLAAAGLLVWPQGQFPLDDDWNFAMTTWRFAETGRFVFPPYAAMSLRAQAIWGALWTLAFGKSFEVLRCSTFVLALGTLFVVHGILCRLGVARPLRLLATFALMFHPVFFWSSFTYMTQVPFLFLSVVAMSLFLRGFAEDRTSSFVWGAVAVVASYFVRQTGVINAVPPIAALLLARQSIPHRRKRLGICLVPVALFLLLFLFTTVLVGNRAEFATHLTPWHEQNPVSYALVLLFHHVTFNLQNAAIFLLPLTWLVICDRRWYRAARWLCGTLVMLFLIRAVELVVSGAPIPYFGAGPSSIQRGNVFVNLGLGPQTLRDIWVLGLDYTLVLPLPVRMALTFISAAAGALLLAWIFVSLWSEVRSEEGQDSDEARRIPLILLTTHAIAGTLILCVSSIYFDRYSLDSLWSLAILIPFVVQQNGVLRLAGAWTMLVFVGAFSILATQEYFEWNRARWTAFAFLQARGVSLRQMDGGYEINQYLLGGFDGPGHLRLPGFSVVDDEYLLTFQPLAGYHELGSFPYRGYLGLHRGAVFALERDRRNVPSPGK